MATLVLQVAGAALGGVLGPLGATIGAAAGALAGYAVDQYLFGSTVEGARLSDLNVQRSEEGAAIPRVYGKARLSGQVIWATRFEEVKSEDGGKGGASVINYSYYANFAIGLCEGPIARIGRCWADGDEIDLSTVYHRVYTGTEGQGTDSLIAAKQGTAGTPAYRGTAIVVFERLPITDYGNRLPQLAFEVFRPAGGLEDEIRSVVIIPAASEFAYDPNPVYRVGEIGSRETVNRHVDGAQTDWQASLDELQSLCPNLDRAALAVTWFGSDLRADHCTVTPRVEAYGTATSPTEWSVSGLTRAGAALVSQIGGRPAYGGTPSDASVLRAIVDLKVRGLAVTYYPFLMMDVPAGNALTDPYGWGTQPAYPWRGRITASWAPGMSGSPDKTSAVEAEIAAFMGMAQRTDFATAGASVVYSGPAEWSYRRMVLHSAWLCVVAGGVDAFIIGSELRGLTTLRSAGNAYPFVAALKTLAADVRAILGASCKITYAADWSEYFGHQPADGSGDAFFHLDPLWTDPAIDAVGIDSYVPLSDWRDGADHLDAAVADSGRDIAYLRSNIAGGEGFDWYYGSDSDRAAQIRSPITDGGYGKPWVYRYKDLKSWWSQPHFNRVGYVEQASPTAWVPEGKPIWFTEIGCPAIDKGANEPNVFPDPKVGGSRLPHFSNGSRDALMQERALSAILSHWDPASPDFSAASNPVSSVYGGRMVDIGPHLCLVLGCASLSGLSISHRCLVRWRQLADRPLAERPARNLVGHPPRRAHPARLWVHRLRDRRSGRDGRWLCDRQRRLRAAGPSAAGRGAGLHGRRIRQRHPLHALQPRKGDDRRERTCRSGRGPAGQPPPRAGDGASGGSRPRLHRSAERLSVAHRRFATAGDGQPPAIIVVDGHRHG